jgi:hypothetical protein
MDRKKGQKSLPAPQLARPCYSLDSSSSDEEDSFLLGSKGGAKPSSKNDNGEDDSSLEILPPKVKKTKLTVAPPIKSENIAKGNTRETPIDLSISPPPVKKSSINRTLPSSSLPSATIKAMQTSKKNSTKMSLSAKPPPAATRNTSTASATLKQGTAKLGKASNVLRMSQDFSSSDDDDDDDILLSRPTFQSREEIKERKKREREEEKEREKRAKARKRQEEKEARERQKEREKAAKKKENETFAQSAGKYKHDEIAILMDPSIHENDPLGLVQKLSPDFLVHSYASKMSMAPAAIQFVRKEYLSGGAKDAVDCLESDKTDGYEHIHDLVVILEPDDFIPLLQRLDKTEDDDYPRLEEWLASIKSKWQRRWKIASPVEPRLLLLLRNVPEALDKLWVQHRRRSSTDASPPTAWELQDAIQWLLIQFQVECMHCPNEDLIQLTIHKMARSLCDKPYRSQVSELECVRKIKQGPSVSSDDPVDKARDIWLRQLQLIPGISENMALNVVERYPTCQSLWQAYRELQQQPHGAPALLLSNILTAGKSCRVKLSQTVFRIMTSNDPEEMIL